MSNHPRLPYVTRSIPIRLRRLVFESLEHRHMLSGLTGYANGGGYHFLGGDQTQPNYQPRGSQVQTTTELQWKATIGTTYGHTLTGDVDGDGKLELVRAEGNVLSIYDHQGNVQTQRTMPTSGDLRMLDDVNGDGIIDIGIAGKQPNARIAYCFFYDGQGNLIKAFQRSVGYDGAIYPVAVTSPGKVLVLGGAGYSMNPRGLFQYDYATGNVDWSYGYGFPNGPASVADIDRDGKLETTIGWATVHNGHQVNGTSDGELYLTITDDHGANLLKKMYPSPNDGAARHIFNDLDKDGIYEIIAVEMHDPQYYHGYNEVHLFDLHGNTLHTHTGPYDEDWSWAVGDIDKDGWDNVIVGGRSVLTVLNHRLQVIRSIADNGYVQIAVDLTGDGYAEIVTTTSDNLLRVYDYQLNLIDSIQLSGSTGHGYPGLVMADDIDDDGIVELVVRSSTGSHILAFGGKDTDMTPQMAEILARGVAYVGTWREGADVRYDNVSLGYKVDVVFDCDACVDAGFYGLGLISSQYGPALVLRGTEPDTLADWWADFDRRGVGYSQFEAAWPTVSEWLEGLGQSVDIIGHSLGGAVAQWIAAAFTSDDEKVAGGGKIDQLVTFNSPGITDSSSVYRNLLTYAHRFNPENAESVTHYVVNGDVVSMAGEAFLAGDVMMASFSDWNPINKHVRPLLNPRMLTAGTNEYRDRPTDLELVDYSIDALNRPWFRFTDAQYHTWLVGLQVGLHVAKLHALAPLPRLLVYRSTTEGARQTLGHALRGAEFVGRAADAYGRFVLNLHTQARELYRQLTITVAPDFDLRVEQDALRLDGGLSMNLGKDVHIILPSWLGGSFTADSLVDLVELDTHGVLDGDSLRVNGQLALLGDLVELNGSARLDWGRGELTVTGDIDILDGFVTANGGATIDANGHFVLRGEAEIQIPKNAPVPFKGKTISGGQFLLNYVADLNPSTDFVAAWGNVGRLQLGLQVWFDGNVKILGGNEIKRLESGLAGEGEIPLQEPSYGEWYEIPSDKDWALFSIEWENASSEVGFRLQTPSGQILDAADIAADPSMQIVPELTDDYRTVIRVDSPQAGAWQVILDDTTGRGAVETMVLVFVPPPEASIQSVRGGLLREPVEIEMAVSVPSPEVSVALFYDADAGGHDGVLIADGLTVSDDGLIEYVWDTNSVASGEYYLYARVFDSVNPPTYAYSAESVRITDRVPVVSSVSASPNPVVRPAQFLISVEPCFDPSEEILQVEFYDGDVALGADANGSDGWNWTVSTGTMPLGEVTFSARAQHVGGLWSGPVSTTVWVCLELESMEFGPVPMFAARERKWAFHNEGIAALQVQAAHFDLPFAIRPIDGSGDDGDWTVLPGETKEFAIRFQPVEEGTHQAALALIGEADGRMAQFSGWAVSGHQNPCNPFDVSGDGYVTPQDVLLLINEINHGGDGPLLPRTAEHPGSPWFLDVTGSGTLVPNDVLQVINYINRGGAVEELPNDAGEGESDNDDVQSLDCGWWAMIEAVGSSASAVVPSSLPKTAFRIRQARTKDRPESTSCTHRRSGRRKHQPIPCPCAAWRRGQTCHHRAVPSVRTSTQT
jgi:pimeloyl-ACP methyl ester carboxylesterase